MLEPNVEVSLLVPLGMEEKINVAAFLAIVEALTLYFDVPKVAICADCVLLCGTKGAARSWKAGFVTRALCQRECRSRSGHTLRTQCQVLHVGNYLIMFLPLSHKLPSFLW